MTYTIVFNKAVANQIMRLPGYIKAIVRQQIAALSDDPRLPHSKELAGHDGYYRIWLGPRYRFVWQVDDEAQIITIRTLAPRHPIFMPH